MKRRGKTFATQPFEIGYRCGLRGQQTCRENFGRIPDAEMQWYRGYRQGLAERLRRIEAGEWTVTDRHADDPEMIRAEGKTEYKRIEL